MKHLIIVIIVLVVIFSLGIFEQIYAKDALSNMLYTIDDIIVSLNKGDLKSAHALQNKLESYYHGKEKILEMLFTHGEFKDVPNLIGELKGNIDTQDTKQAIVRAYVLKEDIRTHMNILSFRIENIL